MKKEFKFLKTNHKSTITLITLISYITFLVTCILIFYNYFDSIYDEISSANGNQVTVTSSTPNIDLSTMYNLAIENRPEFYTNTQPVNIQNMNINVINNGSNITSTLISVDVDLNYYFELNNVNIDKTYDNIGNYEVIISSSIAEKYAISNGDELSFTTESSLTNSWKIPTLKVVGVVNSQSHGNFLYTNKTTIESIADITGEAINKSLTIFTNSKEDTRDILLYLEKHHDNASFSYDFSLNNQLYDIALIPTYDQLTSFIFLLIFSSILVIVIYIVLYSYIMKKRRSEIRIYYYLGMRYYAVAKVFFKESLIITIVAFIIGFITSVIYSVSFLSTIIKTINGFDINFIVTNNSTLALSSLFTIFISYITIGIILLIIHIIIYNYNLKKVKFNV